MRNFPKHLNSKADYEYIRDHFPRAKWLPHWKALLNHKQWFVTSVLESADAGVTDDTHRVRTDTTKATEEGKEDTYTYYQEEYKDDPSADFFRFHFSEEEVEAAIAE